MPKQLDDNTRRQNTRMHLTPLAAVVLVAQTTPWPLAYKRLDICGHAGDRGPTATTPSAGTAAAHDRVSCPTRSRRALGVSGSSPALVFRLSRPQMITVTRANDAGSGCEGHRLPPPAGAGRHPRNRSSCHHTLLGRHRAELALSAPLSISRT